LPISWLCPGTKAWSSPTLPYRTTRDLDVLIEPTLDNARRARRAVERWGGFEPDFTAEDFISGDILSFGGLLRVEFHADVPGVEWPEVWRRRVAGEFLGAPTHFASVEDLIAMKEATGRTDKGPPRPRAPPRPGASRSRSGSGSSPVPVSSNATTRAWRAASRRAASSGRHTGGQAGERAPLTSLNLVVRAAACRRRL